jgi:sugar/nucleoside kinase (ribokinase family)
VSRYDYVAVGHVTRDVLADGSSRAGGTALYSGLQAARLGLRTLILTQGRREEIELLLAPWRDELDVKVLPAAQTTTLATRGAGEHRSQRLLSWAGEMTEPPIPRCSILHWAGIARELPNLGESDDCVITPQGLLRHWRARTGEIYLAPLPEELLPERFSAAVLSHHEHAYCGPLLAAARRCGACVAVTAGERAATLHLADGGVLAAPAPAPVHPREDLGAGDVFAAAFFIALGEGLEPTAAASFANTAAAVRIGGIGAEAIGTRAQIEAVLG